MKSCQQACALLQHLQPRDLGDRGRNLSFGGSRYQHTSYSSRKVNPAATPSCSAPPTPDSTQSLSSALLAAGDLGAERRSAAPPPNYFPEKWLARLSGGG